LPLVKKLIDVGKTSKGVIIPKGWLQHIEESEGHNVTRVTIEVDKTLIIAPFFKKGVAKK